MCVWQSDNSALIDVSSRPYFCQNVALLRLNAAWEAARALYVRALWLALSGKAMEVLNVAMALKVYRQLGDAGMVMALEQLLDIEDKNLLAGHIAMLFADYQQVCRENPGTPLYPFALCVTSLDGVLLCSSACGAPNRCECVYVCGGGSNVCRCRRVDGCRDDRITFLGVCLRC